MKSPNETGRLVHILCLALLEDFVCTCFYLSDLANKHLSGIVEASSPLLEDQCRCESVSFFFDQFTHPSNIQSSRLSCETITFTTGIPARGFSSPACSRNEFK